MYEIVLVFVEDQGRKMEIKTWARVLLSLACVLFVGSVEMTLLKKTKGMSKDRHHNIITKSLQSRQKQNSFKKHSSEYSARNKHGFRLKKRGDFKTSFKNKIDVPREIIVTRFPTDGKSKAQSLQLQHEIQHGLNQRRNVISDPVKELKQNGRWEGNSLEESDDGLIKRSRNRVRLKSQLSHHRKTESHRDRFTTKQSTLKKSASRTVPAEIKRQRISERFTKNDSPNYLDNGNNQVTSDEEMRLATNPDNFFADPVASNSEIRAFHPSHFYAPAVHKFLPAEHRYPSPPIHRYLASPVIFKGANDALVNAGQSSADIRGIAAQERHFEVGPQPLSQRLPHHRQHIIVVKRPFQNPFSMPIPGPSRVVVLRQPLPLPPQRVPVPVMIPRPPPFVIVHHGDFSAPGTFEC